MYITDIKELQETDTWALYDKAVSFCRLIGMYTDTDVNYRMYNGDQWAGLKITGVEKIQYNFIKPIVRYKTSAVCANLYSIHYSSENYENKAFRPTAERICELLNKRASKIWEKDYMDLKLRAVVKDAAINDEGVIYVDYDTEKEMPVNEVINKTDIYYGNENNPDIQSQPYILIKQRKPVLQVKEIARQNGVSEKELDHILGDMEYIEEAGESAKYEKESMCTVITKLYKENGTVHFSKSTRCVDIKEDTDTGLTYYPVAHLLWEEKKGSARGEGEVRQLIPNQLETNKTAMRRALSVKNTAYPTKVYNSRKIKNPNEVKTVGGTIKVDSDTVDDVRKTITYLQPAQMSTDAKENQNELIEFTRELAGAGDIATGQINPEEASGRAILAVQRASQQPLTEPTQYTKGFVEDLARIWLDMTTVYGENLKLEEEITDPVTGQTTIQLVEVPQVSMQALQGDVKVEITPKGAFDKYAQELSVENLLKDGFFTPEKIQQLKLYAKILDDDSVMPKQKILKLIEEYEKEQRKIAQIEMQGQMMAQMAQQFLMEGPQAQAGQMAAVQRPMSQIAPVQTGEPEVIEDNPDDN